MRDEASRQTRDIRDSPYNGNSVDLHLPLDRVVVHQPDRSVVRAHIAQHIPDQQLTGIARSDYQHSASRRAHYVKPFTEPANHQPDTCEKESAEHTCENNDRAGIGDPPKKTMHHTVEHRRTDDGGPENTA